VEPIECSVLTSSPIGILLSYKHQPASPGRVRGDYEINMKPHYTAMLFTIGMIALLGLWMFRSPLTSEAVPANSEGHGAPIAANPAISTPDGTDATANASGSGAGTTQRTHAYRYSFEIVRSTTPPLSYTDLTYIVHLGAISDPYITIDGNLVASSRHAASTGNLIFSSAATGTAVIEFNASQPPTDIHVTIASLKDNKAWAWSHGMDDNTMLMEQINLIAEKGWRASVMLISKEIDDTREEGWILDKPALLRLRNEGWSLSNHTWDHNCGEGRSKNTYRQTVLAGYNRLMEIVADSDTPDYRILSFAAPCFISDYTPVIAEMRATGETTMLFNEAQGNPLLNVDGTDYENGAIRADGFTSDEVTIGRYTGIWDVEATREIFDWMAANAGPERHFWFNSLTHGQEEDRLGPLLDYVYTNYGPDGTDELWMAPSDAIYSYVYLRNHTTIQGGTLTTNANPTTFNNRVFCPDVTLTRQPQPAIS
jgi:hypothetical protein